MPHIMCLTQCSQSLQLILVVGTVRSADLKHLVLAVTAGLAQQDSVRPWNQRKTCLKVTWNQQEVKLLVESVEIDTLNCINDLLSQEEEEDTFSEVFQSQVQLVIQVTVFPSDVSRYKVCLISGSANSELEHSKH